MSVSRAKTIKCPDCNCENKITYWQSVNVDTDPGTRELVKNGKLFEVKCKKCKKIFDVEYSFLYHDIINKFMIWYYPYGEYNLEEEEKKINKEIDIRLYDNLRVLEGRKTLLEKIRIFEDGLNDIIIEVIKQIICLNVEEEQIEIFYSEKKDDLLYFALSNGFTATYPYSSYLDALKEMDYKQPKDFAIVNGKTLLNYIKLKDDNKE